MHRNPSNTLNLNKKWPSINSPFYTAGSFFLSTKSPTTLKLNPYITDQPSTSLPFPHKYTHNYACTPPPTNDSALKKKKNSPIPTWKKLHIIHIMYSQKKIPGKQSRAIVMVFWPAVLSLAPAVALTRSWRARMSQGSFFARLFFRNGQIYPHTSIHWLSGESW